MINTPSQKRRELNKHNLLGREIHAILDRIPALKQNSGISEEVGDEDEKMKSCKKKGKIRESEEKNVKKNRELKIKKEIKRILEENSDILANRAVVGDFISFQKEEGGKMTRITQFKGKYGISSITVKNLSSLIVFCAVHGLIPMVDKIYIDKTDVSSIKNLYNFFAFVASIPENPTILITLGNEIKKLEGSLQGPAKEVLDCFKMLIDYTTSKYQYLLGNGLQKINNIGTLSENIFLEIAIRLENYIRDKKIIGMESSYLVPAGYNDDMQRKKDMDFVFKKTPESKYQIIPMQFTTAVGIGQENKEKDIERYLINNINNNKGRTGNGFLLVTVNGDFAKHMGHGNIEKENTLEKKYHEWINSPEMREENKGDKFPLFLDLIDSKITLSADVIYIALNMLYKNFRFRYSNNENYLNELNNVGKKFKNNNLEINGIKISDITIDKCSIEKKTNPRPKYPGIMKHKFEISYQGEDMGVIIVYQVENQER